MNLFREDDFWNETINLTHYNPLYVSEFSNFKKSAYGAGITIDMPYNISHTDMEKAVSQLKKFTEDVLYECRIILPFRRTVFHEDKGFIIDPNNKSNFLKQNGCISNEKDYLAEFRYHPQFIIEDTEGKRKKVLRILIFFFTYNYERSRVLYHVLDSDKINQLFIKACTFVFMNKTPNASLYFIFSKMNTRRIYNQLTLNKQLLEFVNPLPKPIKLTPEEKTKRSQNKIPEPPTKSKKCRVSFNDNF